MRETKFRAIHPTGGLVYFNLKSIDGYGSIMMDDGFQSIEDCDLSQFTGLIDSTGKEVYEGDILQFADMHNGTGVIEFVGNGYWVTDNNGKHHLPTNRKVIGNIYQNPELIPL